jgi:hypothetical protein
LAKRIILFPFSTLSTDKFVKKLFNDKNRGGKVLPSLWADEQMVDEEQDAEASEKIFEAAERIADMAAARPWEAQRLLERAEYLRGLAEQIRRDRERRFAVPAHS